MDESKFAQSVIYILHSEDFKPAPLPFKPQPGLNVSYLHTCFLFHPGTMEWSQEKRRIIY